MIPMIPMFLFQLTSPPVDVCMFQAVPMAAGSIVDGGVARRAGGFRGVDAAGWGLGPGDGCWTH